MLIPVPFALGLDTGYFGISRRSNIGFIILVREGSIVCEGLVPFAYERFCAGGAQCAWTLK